MFNNINLEQLQCVLAELGSASRNIIGIGVTTQDGICIASNLPQTINEDQLASTGAAFVNLSHHAAEQFFDGAVKKALCKTEQGLLLAMPYGEHFVLTILLNADTENHQVTQIAGHVSEKLEYILA